MSCDIDTYAGYHILTTEEISVLTNEQERLFWRQLAERYEREMRIQTETRMFRNRVEHHTQMRGPELTADLLRLKKPILPNRWINFREGWCSAAWGFTNENLRQAAYQDFAKEIEKAAEYLKMAPHTQNAVLVADDKHLTLRWEEP